MVEVDNFIKFITIDIDQVLLHLANLNQIKDIIDLFMVAIIRMDINIIIIIIIIIIILLRKNFKKKFPTN